MQVKNKEELNKQVKEEEELNMQVKEKDEANMQVKKKECVEHEYLAAKSRHQQLKNLPREQRKAGHAEELKSAWQRMVNLKKKVEAPVKAPKTAAERKREVISYCYKRCILQKNIKQQNTKFLPSPGTTRARRGRSHGSWLTGLGMQRLEYLYLLSIFGPNLHMVTFQLFIMLTAGTRGQEEEEGGLQD